MRVVRVPPIGGIAMVHEFPDAMPFEPRLPVEWDGVAETEEPIRIAHEVGSIDVEGWRELARIGPSNPYLLSAKSDSAVFFPGWGQTPAQLVSIVDSRREFVIRYASPLERWAELWDRDLAAYLLAISARGNALLAHACGFLLPDGRAVLAPGHSNSGKSTLARLLLQGDSGCIALNDDRNVLKVQDTRVEMFSTPWHGQGGRAVAGGGPLASVMFIRKGGAPAIVRLRRYEVVRRLLEAVPLAMWSDEQMEAQLSMIATIADTVPAFEANYPSTTDGVMAIVDLLAAAETAYV
jgi:hypothetical protein